MCGDNVPASREQAVDGFGFREATDDWKAVVEHPDVDVVYVTAPNMLHEEVCLSPSLGRRQARLLREAGRRHPTADRPHRRRRPPDIGVSRVSGTTTAGPRSCSTPSASSPKGRLGEITNYRGRFFSTYGTDPLGLLSWRFLVDEGGYGVSSDILSHSIDLALFPARSDHQCDGHNGDVHQGTAAGLKKVEPNYDRRRLPG